MNVASIIAILLISAIVGLVYMLALLGKTDTDTFKILVGALMSVGFTNVIGFYFTSSVQSRAKDETIVKLASGGTIATAAAEKAALPAARKAAPPVVEAVVPPVVEAAVTKAFEKQSKRRGK